MDNQTAEALEASITKWKENLQRAEAGHWNSLRVSASECPLCDLFFRWMNTAGPCNGCPVSARTGMHHCGGTPYSKVVEELRACQETHPARPLLAYLIAEVKAEVEFLESLREG